MSGDNTNALTAEVIKLVNLVCDLKIEAEKNREKMERYEKELLTFHKDLKVLTNLVAQSRQPIPDEVERERNRIKGKRPPHMAETIAALREKYGEDFDKI